MALCVSRLEGPKGCEARSEANPGRWRPERSEGHALI